MERNEKNKKNTDSKATTVGFLVLAALLLYGALHFSGRIVARELLQTPVPQEPEQIWQAETAPTPTPPEPTADTVIAIRTPEPASAPAPGGTAEPSAATPTPASPSPTPIPLPSRFEEEWLDLAVIGFDANGRADLIAVLAVRGSDCTLLALPKNTFSAGAPFATVSSTATVLRRLSNLLNISFNHYVSFQEAAIPACVDALGGVTIDGTKYTGAQAFAYLQAEGQDEILRAARQQVFLQAFSKRVQNLNLLQMWSAKRTLQGSATTNLNGEQGWLLYHTLKALDVDAMKLQLLPVDSVVENGVRYYRADEEILEKIVSDLYKNR